MFHVIRETEHTPQVSMDFPVSFASTGSGKSLSGLYGFSVISAAGRAAVGGGAPSPNVYVGPLSFWSSEGGPKSGLKKEPLFKAFSGAFRSNRWTS